MRDIDRRDPDALVKRADLGARMDAQLGVEVGKRLVHKEGARLAYDSAAECDALALSARKRLRSPVQQMVDCEDLGRRANPPVDLCLGHPTHLEPEAHILTHRQMRVESIVLENHRDVAVARGKIRHVPVADHDLAAACRLQPGKNFQHR